MFSVYNAKVMGSKAQCGQTWGGGGGGGGAVF